MKILQKKNTIIIKDSSNDLNHFVTNLTHELTNYTNKNSIIDISSYKNISAKDITISFLDLAKNKKKGKKSFVIVITDFDFNKASDKINIVPTIQEAHDIIEMEEIERDLGF